MFKKRFSDFINEFDSFYLIIIGVPLFLYGLYIKETEIITYSIQNNMPLGFWDLIILIISDKNIISYFVLPIVCILSIKTINECDNNYILIRMKSFKEFVIHIYDKFTKRILSFLTIWVIIAVILSIDHIGNLSWIHINNINTEKLDIMNILKHYISSPLIGIFLQLIGLFLIFQTINLLFIYIKIFCKKNIYLIIFSLVIFLFNLITSKISFIFGDFGRIISLITPINYLCSYLGILLYESALKYFVIICILFISIRVPFLCNFKIKNLFNIISKYKIQIIYFLSLVLYIVFRIKPYINMDINLMDILVIILFGVTNANGSISTIISYIFIFWGLVYFLQDYLNIELGGLHYSKIIRYRSVHEWFNSYMKKVIVYIIKALILLMLITLAISSLFKFSGFYNSVFQNINLSVLLYQFFVNGFLQMLFYVLFVFIVTWDTQNTFIGFSALLGTSVFMFRGFNTYYVLPLALNSLGIVVENKVSVFYITTIIILYIFVELLYIRKLLKNDVF